MRDQARRAESLLPVGEASRPALALRARRGPGRCSSASPRSWPSFLLRGASSARGGHPGHARRDRDRERTPSPRGGPTTTARARRRWRTSSSAGYLHEVPRDAWGHPLAGDLPGPPRPRWVRRLSDGPDGEPGGTGSGGVTGRTKRRASLKELEMRVRQSRISRAAARGLTLVELVIVITIIGVLTAAISVGVMRAKKTADIGTAKTACNSIKQRHDPVEERAPRRGLPHGRGAEEGEVPRHGLQPKDSWGNPFKITCDTDEITCTTAGPTARKGPRTTSSSRPPDATGK